MKNCFNLALMIFTFISSLNLSQSRSGNISGTISDLSSNENLPNVNIFLSKTTIGTTSNFAGNFSINNINEGKYTLVASMIGYESFIKKIEIKKDSKIVLNIFLKPKAVELNTVEIIGDKNLYEQYLKEQYEYRKIFKKYFLGQTKFSEQCEILNEDKIVFKKNTLGFIEAKCPEPIIIINNAFGYKIECVLDYFLCNDKIGSVQMLFFLKYTELEPSDEDQFEIWRENRESAYISSLRRFLLVVINNEVQYNDYGLFLTNNTFNIQNIPRAKLLYGFEKISKVDSISNKLKLSFEGFLMVHNNRTQEFSWIKLPFGEAELSNDGYVEDPLSMTVYNTFATHGIADSLPDNILIEN